MPGGRDPADSEGTPPDLSFWQRLLLVLPRLRHDGVKAPLGERLRDSLVKPVEPGRASKTNDPDAPRSVEELEEAVRSADDKERLTGLLLAPAAAAIGILVINLLIADNPARNLKNGARNPRYVDPSTYHNLALVLLVLAVLMLGTAYFRKRLFLGIVMALYGLAVFNLHYWGFGIPYILAGAWLLVRAYRLQRDLREAKGDSPRRAGAGGRDRRPTTPRPTSNKRYTRPSAPPKRPPPPKTKSKPEDEQRAG